ncbi:hypothetical protein JL721_11770 [Aureococcus anophagefferens]|nr:hypothetical protein JL721_11770 [Aureococcus anophagefferens]
MGGDRVNVFARVRPLGSARAESDSEAVRLDGDTNITVDDIEGAINESLRGSSGASLGDALKASAQRKTFEFDGVFGGESEQAEVFKEVGLPVVDAVLAGYHGCVFAYGQTGSGKTYSLLHGGSAAQSFQDSGLLPRLAATLYVKAARDVAHDYTVEAGCFQVYNEQVSDLLHPEHRSGKGANLSVSKDRSGHGQVDQLTFASARKNVVYAETKMNKASSRSHACFQLRVSRRPKQAGARGTVSLCSVVDLAGSERVKRSGVAGKELKEAININGSLLALGNVVAALAAKKKHVPYRDSKLTRAAAASEAAAKEARAERLKFERAAADSQAKGSRPRRRARRPRPRRSGSREGEAGARELEAACASAKNEEKRRLDAEERLALLELSAAKDAERLKLRLDEVSKARDESKSESARLEEALAEARKQARERQLAFAKEERALADQVKAAEHAQKATGDDLDAARKEIDDIMRELREAKETLATRAAVSEDEVNAERARRDDIAARLEAEVSRERDKAAGLEEALAGASAKLEVSERARDRSACESALERAAIAASQRVALEAREAAERKRLARAAAAQDARAVAPTAPRPRGRGETAQLAEDLRKEASDGAARVELAERLRAQQADRHAAAEKRLAWAFSAARRCQEQKERQVLGELDVLASRFNARESRGDDLEKISRLKGSVLAERERAARLDRARTLTQLELDNERASDKIFGVESEAARKSKAARRRDEVARAAVRARGRGPQARRHGEDPEDAGDLLKRACSNCKSF